MTSEHIFQSADIMKNPLINLIRLINFVLWVTLLTFTPAQDTYF